MFKMPKECAELVEPRNAYAVKATGTALLCSDLHIPYHDNKVVEVTLNDAKDRGANILLFNGDVFDCPQLSRHRQFKSAPKFKDDVSKGVAFFTQVRKEFPKAEIIFKAGNHEEWLDAYISTHAAAFEGLVSLPSLLHLDDLGIKWVCDKRMIKLGKLNVFHGHEFGSGSGGANVARWLLLRSGGGTASACGHFHRTDSAGGRNSNDFLSAAWGVGCLCKLDPFWLAQNQWNHGYALVDLAKGGDFQFHNRRIIHGRIYPT